MKRDFTLIRRILSDIEKDAPAGSGYFRIDYAGEFDDRLVWAHLELLIEARLVEGTVIRGMDGIHGVNVRGLTWEGHEFIEAAAKDNLWDKAMKTIKDKGGALTFDVLKELLNTLAKSTVGLP